MDVSLMYNKPQRYWSCYCSNGGMGPSAGDKACLPSRGVALQGSKRSWRDLTVAGKETVKPYMRRKGSLSQRQSLSAIYWSKAGLDENAHLINRSAPATEAPTDIHIIMGDVNLWPAMRPIDQTFPKIGSEWRAVLSLQHHSPAPPVAAEGW